MKELIDIYNIFLTIKFIPDLMDNILATAILFIIFLTFLISFIREYKSDKSRISKETSKNLIIMCSLFLMLVVGMFSTEAYKQSNREDINNAQFQSFNKALSYKQRSLLNQEVYFWLKERSLLEKCSLNDCDVTLTKEQLLSKSEQLYFGYETISTFFKNKKYEIKPTEENIKEERVRKSIQKMRSEILDLKME